MPTNTRHRPRRKPAPPSLDATLDRLLAAIARDPKAKAWRAWAKRLQAGDQPARKVVPR